MLDWLVAALTGPALLLGATPSTGPAPDAPDVSPGVARFNDPFGTPDEQYALIRHIEAKIDHAPRGATVRLAAYSFAMPSTAQSLLRAHRRGVRVQVVVDDRSASWGSVLNLRGALGTDTHRHSFVRVCRKSCRGTSGNQHAKFVTVSRTGHSRAVVMVGSMNFTVYAAARQWQDLYTVRDDVRLFRQFRHVFRSMVRDRPQGRLGLRAVGHGFRTEVAPIADGAPDPVERRLHRVVCDGATHGTGVGGRTLVRVSLHAWNGERGVRIARKVARLTRQGCSVRVLAGVGFGRRVTSILDRSDVPLRDSGHDGRSTHEKLMFVSGHFGRATDASYVWTGSHNWTDLSLRNDEVTLRVAGARAVSAYQRNFARIWNSADPGKPG